MQGVKDVKPFPVQTASKQPLFAIKVGTARVGNFTLTSVYFVPGLASNLISVNKIARENLTVTFSQGQCRITGNDKSLTIPSKHGMYSINALHVTSAGEGAVITLQSAHELFGHINKATVKNALTNGPLPLKIHPKADVHQSCDTCIATKTTRSNIPKTAVPRNLKLGDLISADVWGPSQALGYDNSKYFVLFVDAATKFYHVRAVTHKYQAFKCFTELYEFFVTQFQVKMKTLRTDNGGEFRSDEFKRFTSAKGIVHEFTNAFSSFQNGLDERAIRTVTEGGRCLLQQFQIAFKYWPLAVNHFVLCRNMINSTGTAPFATATRDNLSVDHLHLFGQPIWVHIPRQNRRKLDNTAVKAVYVGVDPRRKGILYLRNGQINSTRDYRIPLKREKMSIASDEYFESSDEDASDEESVQPSSAGPSKNLPTHRKSISSLTPEETRARIKELKEELGLTDTDKPDVFKNKSGTSVGFTEDPLPPQHINSDISQSNVVEGTRNRPTHALAVKVLISPKKALSEPSWKASMKREMNSQIENKTWLLVKREPGMKVLPCSWVYTIKTDAEGQKTYKSRLVIGGNHQTFGLDYNETFAPVVKYTTVRLALAIATYLNWEVHQMDFVTAFLNASVDEQIFMRQPAGFEVDGPDTVCKLSKSLYGLKQAPRRWNEMFDECLLSLGYLRGTADTSIYLKNGIIICVYVDDIILLSPFMDFIDEFKSQISRKFKVKDLGPLKLILGMRWTRDRKQGTSFLSQEEYTLSILERFGMADCKPVSTPAVKPDEVESPALKDNLTYMEIVGSLIHLSNLTRPDISFAVNYQARFMQKPSEADLIAVKRIMRYLKGTAAYGLNYCSTGSTLVGYSDADWAGDKDSRRSTSGYAFQLGKNLISWSSKKQSTVALSSSEAEYMASSFATQELIWLKALIKEIKFKIPVPILKQDNQSSIALAKNPVHHPRTKHIDIRYHFIRERVLNSELQLEFCPTTEMAADMLTKPLSQQLLVPCRTILQVAPSRGSVEC